MDFPTIFHLTGVAGKSRASPRDLFRESAGEIMWDLTAGGSTPSSYVSNVTFHPRSAQWFAMIDMTRSAPPPRSE